MWDGFTVEIMNVVRELGAVVTTGGSEGMCMIVVPEFKVSCCTKVMFNTIAG